MRDDVVGGFVTHTSDKAAAFHNNIYSGGHNKYNASHEGVDVDFLVLMPPQKASRRAPLNVSP